MASGATGQSAAGSRPAGAPRLLPAGTDALTVGLLVAGLLLMYGPTFWDLNQGLWATDAQSFGPIILGASLWLFWRDRQGLAALPAAPRPALAWLVLMPSLLLYSFGRSQDIWIFEVGSLLSMLCGCFLLFKGAPAIKLVGVQLALLAFLIPWPGGLVAALTGPLKAGVSVVAANLLHATGYPVGRTGVMLTVGQYQLLVADACAGLNSIVTLEAIGLIYMKLMNYQSALRNTLLAVLLVPISFVSNVARVVILVLVTYHFGDEAGQGFIHGAAGIVLFLVATVLMLATDSLMGVCLTLWQRRKPARANA